MAALGSPVLINPSRSYWLSTIGNDVIHSTIQVDTIDANVANISTLFADNITASTSLFSTFGVQNLDVSGMYVSSLNGNTGFLSSLSLASGLQGGVGYVRFAVDPSGIQVDGDPIRFDNLVYLTSTINIIQVSTLVDTDIFAQNGFFSTLSSGSLSTGNFFTNNAGISSAFISSLVVGDISGYNPANWSLFPTVSGEIIMSTGYNLSNVGSNLFFAGQQLATPSDISGIDTWSLHPAISTLYMNNNVIKGLSTINFQDNATLTSQTGNNLFYNGQQISYGAQGNVANWSGFPAISNVNMQSNALSNASLVTTSNITITGSNITSGNTFTNSLGVGGTSLVSLATIDSGGDLTCRNIDVGDPVTSLADVNIYGNTALPGDNALYVVGGVTFTGNGVPVHGTTIGCGVQVGGFDTIRIDVLPAAGIFQTTTLPWAAQSATSASLTAGGILTLAGGSEIEANTSDFNIINTTSGNKATTLTVGNILAPASVAATSSILIQNIAGGGIQLQAGGQGSMTGFSTIQGSNVSSINLDVSTINGLPFATVVTPSNIVASNVQATISVNTATLNASNSYVGTAFWNQAIGVSTTIGALRVNNIQIPDNITGVTNAPNPLQSRIENFSSIQSGTMSTTNLVVSTINGVPPGGGATNTYQQLFTSSLQTSSIVHGGFPGQREIIVDGNGFNFKNADPTFNARYISSLQYLRSPGINLDIQASTMALSYSGGVNPNGNIRFGSGGAADAYILGSGAVTFSTPTVQANSNYSVLTSTSGLTVSTVSAVGGLPIKFNSLLEFTTPTGIENLTAINFAAQDAFEMNIYASTMNLVANNTTIPSLSTTNLSTANQITSFLNFSIASSAGSNPGYNYPIFIDYDQANNISTGAVAIAVQGHNLAAGAVRNQIEFGARGNGENYIMSVWPGQNLEELFVDCTDLTVRDGNYSTIINLDPFGLQTTGGIKGPFMSTLDLNVSSINNNNALLGYANILQLSSMNLYQNNSTLCWWDSISPNDYVNASGYDIAIGQNGTYKIGASRQFSNQSGNDVVEYYFMKNGVPMEYTNSKTQVVNNSELVAYSEIVDTFVNGDLVQLGQYTTSADIYLSTFPGAYCSSPAVICTVYKIA